MSTATGQRASDSTDDVRTPCQGQRRDSDSTTDIRPSPVLIRRSNEGSPRVPLVMRSGYRGPGSPRANPTRLWPQKNRSCTDGPLREAAPTFVISPASVFACLRAFDHAPSRSNTIVPFQTPMNALGVAFYYLISSASEHATRV
jgi:hypothetical protein